MKIDSRSAIAVGVILAALVGYLWWSQGTPEPANDGEAATEQPVAAEGTAPAPKTAPKTTAVTPSLTTEGIYVVSYKPSGFTPQTLEIATGKSVRFLNNSGKTMRIASMDTTGSPVYSALNQSKTVGQGGVYEYTFIYQGTYAYQNINYPGDQGTIVVK